MPYRPESANDLYFTFIPTLLLFLACFIWQLFSLPLNQQFTCDKSENLCVYAEKSFLAHSYTPVFNFFINDIKNIETENQIRFYDSKNHNEYEEVEDYNPSKYQIISYYRIIFNFEDGTTFTYPLSDVSSSISQEKEMKILQNYFADTMQNNLLVESKKNVDTSMITFLACSLAVILASFIYDYYRKNIHLPSKNELSESISNLSGNIPLLLYVILSLVFLTYFLYSSTELNIIN